MTKLKAIKPQDVEPKRIKMLVFGKAGVGKTWTALSFPNCYYIDTEGGASRPQYMERLAKSGGAYFGREQGSGDFHRVIEEVKTLATEKHDYKTLVIDSFSKLFSSEIAQAIDGMIKQKKDITNTYGSEKKKAVSMSKTLLDWVDRIDMNVILICHEKPLYSDDKNKSIIGTTFDGWDKIDYELDLAVNISRQGGSYYANIAKSRVEDFKYGGQVPWSYKSFSELYGKDIIEKDSEAIELATPDQMSELKELLGKWTPPEGWVAGTLEAAKAEKFSEVDKNKMSKILEYINNKLKGEQNGN